MTLTTILAIMGAQYVRASIPKWRKDVDDWMKNDIDGFLKFKQEVFDTIESSKKHSTIHGFEVINPSL